MSDDLPSRRRFLRHVIAAGSGVLLGACDAASRSTRFTNILGIGEHLSRAAQHALTPRRSMAQEFTAADLSPTFRSNGTSSPDNPEYQRLAERDFVDWRLRVDGLADRPLLFTLAEL